MKTIAIPILAVVLSFNLSCQKEQDTLTKTINVTLAPGESYSTIIKSDDDVLAITQQAEHASVSELKEALCNGERLFTYTPATGYIGNDQVQITSSDEKKHGHGKCPAHNQQDPSTVYVYKITVVGETH